MRKIQKPSSRWDILPNTLHVDKEKGFRLDMIDNGMLRISQINEHGDLQWKYQIIQNKTGPLKKITYMVLENDGTWKSNTNRSIFYHLEYAFKSIGIPNIPGVADRWHSYVLMLEISK